MRKALDKSAEPVDMHSLLAVCTLVQADILACQIGYG